MIILRITVGGADMQSVNGDGGERGGDADDAVGVNRRVITRS